MQHPHTRCPPRDRKPCSGWKIGAGAGRGTALILGAVIAGGHASRFGSDKAAALFAGRPLIDHAIDALRGYAEEIVVIGREWHGRTITDLPVSGLGPLAGIAAALDHASRHGHASVLTIGCDMPNVPGRLIDAILASAPSYCADAPILGHWEIDRAPGLLARLAAGGDRSIRRWAAEIGARAVASGAPLANINTPADLAAL